MQTIHDIAREIVAREGGYVNDPDDPGGATKYGVTLATLRRVRGNDRLSDADLRRLTEAEAVAIFVEHYYQRPHIDLLPETLRASVFDMYVNAGAEAVKLLQRLLCDMRIPVSVDGVVGPVTAAAAARAQSAAPDHLADAYAIARRNYYYDLADRRPASRKYCRRRDGGKGGWITRAESFMSARYRLSDAGHRARVAAWG